LLKRDVAHDWLDRSGVVPHSNQQSRVGTTHTRRSAPDPDGAPPRSIPGPEPGAKETTVVIADLLLIVPAALAGIGGVMLGDRVGLRIKTALASRRRG
jgi:hypothetical protein